MGEKLRSIAGRRAENYVCNGRIDGQNDGN